MPTDRKDSHEYESVRWPSKPGQPRPRFPKTTEERVTKRDESGGKLESEFRVRGRLVGRACWSPDGDVIVSSFRNDVLHGYQLDYRDGCLVHAEPFREGLLHGWAKQFDRAGRLLAKCRFVRGSGTDFWCDDEGRLSEEHPLRDGRLHGLDRWWCEDQKRVFEESAWHEGQLHGIQRRWEGDTMERGFPRFFIRGERVSRRSYLLRARSDASLPRYRAEDDAPERDLPQTFERMRRRICDGSR